MEPNMATDILSCRLCSNNDEDALLDVASEKLKFATEYRQIVRVMTGIKIDPDDRLLSLICRTCIKRAIDNYYYRRIARERNNALLKKRNEIAAIVKAEAEDDDDVEFVSISFDITTKASTSKVLPVAKLEHDYCSTRMPELTNGEQNQCTSASAGDQKIEDTYHNNTPDVEIITVVSDTDVKSDSELITASKFDLEGGLGTYTTKQCSRKEETGPYYCSTTMSELTSGEQNLCTSVTVGNQQIEDNHQNDTPVVEIISIATYKDDKSCSERISTSKLDLEGGLGTHTTKQCSKKKTGPLRRKSKMNCDDSTVISPEKLSKKSKHIDDATFDAKIVEEQSVKAHPSIKLIQNKYPNLIFPMKIIQDWHLNPNVELTHDAVRNHIAKLSRRVRRNRRGLGSTTSTTDNPRLAVPDVLPGNDRDLKELITSSLGLLRVGPPSPIKNVPETIAEISQSCLDNAEFSVQLPKIAAIHGNYDVPSPMKGSESQLEERPVTPKYALPCDMEYSQLHCSDDEDFARPSPSVVSTTQDYSLIKVAEEHAVYVCDQCDLLFRTKKRLTFHSKIHRICVFCSLSFKSIPELKEHIRSSCSKITKRVSVKILKMECDRKIKQLLPEHYFRKINELKALKSSIPCVPLERVSLEPKSDSDPIMPDTVFLNTEFKIEADNDEVIDSQSSIQFSVEANNDEVIDSPSGIQFSVKANNDEVIDSQSSKQFSVETDIYEVIDSPSSIQFSDFETISTDDERSSKRTYDAQFALDISSGDVKKQHAEEAAFIQSVLKDTTYCEEPAEKETTDQCTQLDSKDLISVILGPLGSIKIQNLTMQLSIYDQIPVVLRNQQKKLRVSVENYDPPQQTLNFISFDHITPISLFEYKKNGGINETIQAISPKSFDNKEPLSPIMPVPKSKVPALTTINDSPKSTLYTSKDGISSEHVSIPIRSKWVPKPKKPVSTIEGFEQILSNDDFNKTIKAISPKPLDSKRPLSLKVSVPKSKGPALTKVDDSQKNTACTSIDGISSEHVLVPIRSKRVRKPKKLVSTIKDFGRIIISDEDFAPDDVKEISDEEFSPLHLSPRSPKRKCYSPRKAAVISQRNATLNNMEVTVDKVKKKRAKRKKKSLLDNKKIAQALKEFRQVNPGLLHKPAVVPKKCGTSQRKAAGLDDKSAGIQQENGGLCGKFAGIPQNAGDLRRKAADIQQKPENKGEKVAVAAIKNNESIEGFTPERLVEMLHSGEELPPLIGTTTMDNMTHIIKGMTANVVNFINSPAAIEPTMEEASAIRSQVTVETNDTNFRREAAPSNSTSISTPLNVEVTGQQLKSSDTTITATKVTTVNNGPIEATPSNPTSISSPLIVKVTEQQLKLCDSTIAPTKLTTVDNVPTKNEKVSKKSALIQVPPRKPIFVVKIQNPSKQMSKSPDKYANISFKDTMPPSVQPSENNKTSTIDSVASINIPSTPSCVIIDLTEDEPSSILTEVSIKPTESEMMSTGSSTLPNLRNLHLEQLRTTVEPTVREYSDLTKSTKNSDLPSKLTEVAAKPTEFGQKSIACSALSKLTNNSESSSTILKTVAESVDSDKASTLSKILKLPLKLPVEQTVYDYITAHSNLPKNSETFSKLPVLSDESSQSDKNSTQFPPLSQFLSKKKLMQTTFIKFQQMRLFKTQNRKKRQIVRRPLFPDKAPNILGQEHSNHTVTSELTKLQSESEICSSPNPSNIYFTQPQPKNVQDNQMTCLQYPNEVLFENQQISHLPPSVNHVLSYRPPPLVLLNQNRTRDNSASETRTVQYENITATENLSNLNSHNIL